MKKDSIEILKQLGLTEYESKAYLTLAHLINAKADEISEESEVPRSKIYSVLENLSNKNLINIIQGRPLKYTMIPPNETFKKHKIDLLEKLDKLEEYLTQLYEQQTDTINTPITAIEDTNKIIKKSYSLIDRTRKVLLIRLGFILPSEVDNLKKKINKLIKKDVKIKIIANKKCTIDGENISIEEIFKNMPVEIKYAKLPTAQLIIRDNKEMLLVFAENSAKSIENAEIIGLWNSYSSIVNNYIASFNKQW